MPRNNKKRYEHKKQLEALAEYGATYTDENGHHVTETITEAEEKAFIDGLFELIKEQNVQTIRK